MVALERMVQSFKPWLLLAFFLTIVLGFLIIKGSILIGMCVSIKLLN